MHSRFYSTWFIFWKVFSYFRGNKETFWHKKKKTLLELEAMHTSSMNDLQVWALNCYIEKSPSDKFVISVTSKHQAIWYLETGFHLGALQHIIDKVWINNPNIWTPAEEFVSCNKNPVWTLCLACACCAVSCSPAKPMKYDRKDRPCHDPWIMLPLPPRLPLDLPPLSEVNYSTLTTTGRGVVVD